MYRRILLIINSILLLLPLCACTDVRERLSPDVLAVDLHRDGSAAFAIRCAQDAAEPITASGDSPLMLCTALRTAAGKEIDAGHISLLLLHGNPAAVLPDYLAMQVLMPTSAVLLCRGTSVTHTAYDPAQLRAAVDAGMLPARTADLILGDLQNGSGVSAAPCLSGDTLTLALCGDTDGFPMLSEDACRGLALLGGRWKTFAFRAGDTAASVVRKDLRMTAAEDGDALHFTLTGTVTCKPEGNPAADWLPAAQSALEKMLAAACKEPLESGGADLLLLRETAVRDGIPGAADCTASAWRTRLLQSDFTVDVTAKAASPLNIG